MKYSLLPLLALLAFTGCGGDKPAATASSPAAAPVEKKAAEPAPDAAKVPAPETPAK